MNIWSKASKGNDEHPYQRFHISCKEIEMDYFGYERLFYNFDLKGMDDAQDLIS